MKKITKLAGVFAFSAFLGLTTPVVAQSGDNSTSTSQSSNDDGGDNGKWGLLGLAGLLGLLGRKRKDDHRTTTNR